MPEENFSCHCGEWRFRNAQFIVDDIRRDVCQDLPFYGELDGTFDRPDKVYFAAVRLRPSWFVNVLPELRKFNFTNIDWSDENGRFITIEGELRVIEKLTKHHSRRFTSNCVSSIG